MCAFYTRHQNNFSAVTLTSCFPSSASKRSYCSHVSARPQHVDTTGSPRGMGANTRPGKAGSRLTTATLAQCSQGLLRAAAPQVATAAQLRIQRNRNVTTGWITSTKKASERREKRKIRLTAGSQVIFSKQESMAVLDF